MVRSTTDTVPVIAPPVLRLATIGVPSDRLVKSPGWAGRPPSLETYATVPPSASTTWRGALPTGIFCSRVSVAVSMTPSALAPFSATYSLEPSGDSAIPEGSSEPSAAPDSSLALHAVELTSPLPQSAIASVWVATPVVGLTLNLSR